MLPKHKIGIAFTAIILGVAGGILPSVKSTANPAFVSNYPQFQVNQIKLANIEIGNNKSIYCLTQQHSPLMNTVELLMRLLIIGSFGSVSIAGNSSLVQRYLHILNRDYIIIIYCIIGLLLIMIITSVIIVLFSSTYPGSTPSCPKQIAISFDL